MSRKPNTPKSSLSRLIESARSHVPASSPSRSADLWARAEYLPTLHELAWLASPEGRATCAEMAADRPADTPTAIERWRERLDAERVAAAWTQVTVRAAARVKFTRADEMLFDRVGLEQSTDEIVATHKARRFAGCASIADLCCGVGGDTIALAAVAPVSAVDVSGPRAIMAEHNASVYGRRAAGIIGDVELTHPDADAAHIDPDRRPAGRREHQLDHGSPDLSVVEALICRYHHLAIKMSPGADFDRLPFDAEIELISHHGHCKQAVAWTGNLRTSGPNRSCGNPFPHEAPQSAGAGILSRTRSPREFPAGAGIPSGTHSPRESLPANTPGPSQLVGVSSPVLRRATLLPGNHTIAAATKAELAWPEPKPVAPGGYLLEPDAAVIRANLVGVLARQIQCHVIDPHIAWLVADSAVRSPFAATFQVIDVIPFNQKKLRAWLAARDIGSVDIKTRGTAFHPEDIARRLRLTGSRHAILLITRIGLNPIAILAERMTTA